MRSIILVLGPLVLGWIIAIAITFLRGDTPRAEAGDNRLVWYTAATFDDVTVFIIGDRKSGGCWALAKKAYSTSIAPAPVEACQ
jgi:hypothetical protein